MTLDLGCGPGVVGQLYGDAVGVDRNLAECLSWRRLLGLPAVCADATSLPFRESAFDAVTCHQMIEHVPDEQAAVREIKRVCKPGGEITISSAIRLKWGFYFYRGKDGRLGRLSWDHCREYESAAAFGAALSSLGSVALRQEYFRFPLLDLICNVMAAIRIPIPGFRRVEAKTQCAKREVASGKPV